MPKLFEPNLVLRFTQRKKIGKRNSILIRVFSAIHLTQQINKTVMKAKMIFLTIVILITSKLGLAETIAVTNLNTTGLDVTPILAAKMARLELVKLEKYTVLDEFDMAEVMEQNSAYRSCYGKTCLIELGEKLKVDYVLSGSVDGLANKIVVTIKLIDVNNKILKSTKSVEFDNQEAELQRMLGIVIQEMLGIMPDAVTKTQLEFKNEVITSNNVGRMNNSGPRMGISYVGYGDINEFFTRRESQGGLDIVPVMTNLGYQFEAQYIGTEHFSALGELIINVGGMEQGHFFPSVTLLNGFRFGNGGWEFAFGPSIGARKTTKGIVDEQGNYFRSSEWDAKHYEAWHTNSANVNQTTGDVYVPYVAVDESLYSRTLDSRGNTEFNASWMMAFGRTFKSGALNIPLNLYYSSNSYGGIFGASIGFNVNKSKKSINNSYSK